MKKIKDGGFNSTPEDFQNEYLPIATPLNTEMFKEKYNQKVPEAEFEPEPQFVLPEPEPQFVLPELQFVLPEPFVLPQTPSPIPTLSPIPEPQQQTKYLPFEQEIQQIEQKNISSIYEDQLSQMETQNIYEQLLEQQQQPLITNYTYNDEQDPLQQFLTHAEKTDGNDEKTDDVVMSVITEVLNQPIQVSRTGKNITMLKKQHCLQEEEEEEEEEKEEEREEEREREKEELRTTTKNNKRFHKHLILKKKDDIIKKFPILSQKNSDLIVTAENKYKELKSIFVLKKKYIEKNKELKEHIYGLELVEHRYRCETERLNKKIKK